ncbi:hypothetical protein [Peribacillus frigoritolerans]|uniref:hypothetical protein n=1 Tax=Peribacillus frigoritolerans TaxID=450367 RepID=UPI003B8D86D9
MRFNEFHEVDICNQRSSIDYCFFFCSKTVLLAPHLKRVFYYHYSNYSFWIDSPDLDAAIKWFEHIGEILRVSEQS